MLFHVYSPLGIVLVFLAMAGASFRQHKEVYTEIRSARFEFENHDFSSSDSEEIYRPYLLSTEILFLLAFCFLSANFISIFRPFPIGWDDL